MAKKKPSVRDYALRYLQRGMAILPVANRSKKPAIGQNWPAFRVGADSLDDHFIANRNIGVILGEASGHLIDIDLDSPEAVAAAKLLLPPTGSVFGRKSRPESHYLYISPGSATKKYVDPKTKKVLMEIRADGCQTVIPPSVHPSGERVRWTEDGEPCFVDPRTLTEAANRAAAATLVARYWPQGQRDWTTAAWNAVLLRAGWDGAEIKEWIGAIVAAAGDDEPLARLNKVKVVRKRSSARRPGWPSLRAVLGDQIVDQVSEWLGLKSSHIPDHRAELIVVKASEVKPEAVIPLWPEKLYLGKISLLAGDPGLGKSLVGLDIAARVSRGSPWPDESGECPKGEVIILSAEDGAADTIRPRLEMAGADLERIHLIEGTRIPEGESTGNERAFNLGADLEKLESELDKLGGRVKLVLIDPVSAYMPRIDTDNNAEVRSAFMPLNKAAEKHRTCVLLIAHLNKNSDSNAIYRVSGSVAFTAVARSAFLITRDKDHSAQRLLIPLKNNLGNDKTGVRYEVVSRNYDPTGASIPSIEWLDTIEESADDALQRPSGRKAGTVEGVHEASRWLAEYLRNGPKGAVDVWNGVAAQGLSKRHIHLAKAQLNVSIKFKNRKWVWALPTLKPDRE